MKTKALAALLLCGTLLTGLTACGGDSDVTMKQSDLPYGATLALKKEAGKPTIQYDSRFVPEECFDTLLTYYDCIVTQNAEQFASIQLPVYHDYQLETMLEGKYTDAQILENSHEAFKQYFGGEFAFAMLDITECLDKDASSTGENLLTMIDGLYEDAGKSEKFSDGVSDLREMKITRYLAAAGSGKDTETNCALEDETLVLLKYADKWYVIYN